MINTNIFRYTTRMRMWILLYEMTSIHCLLLSWKKTVWVVLYLWVAVYTSTVHGSAARIVSCINSCTMLQQELHHRQMASACCTRAYTTQTCTCICISQSMVYTKKCICIWPSKWQYWGMQNKPKTISCVCYITFNHVNNIKLTRPSVSVHVMVSKATWRCWGISYDIHWHLRQTPSKCTTYPEHVCFPSVKHW